MADVDVKKRGLESGGWDAIHVIEVRPSSARQAHYKLTSTIMLRLATDHSTGANSTGALKLSGSMTRQQEATCEFSGKEATAHLPNMGRLIEEMENRMRDSLQAVYFGKTKSTISALCMRGALLAEQCTLHSCPARLITIQCSTSNRQNIPTLLADKVSGVALDAQKSALASELGKTLGKKG